MGSNPTQSTSFNLVNYGVALRLFLVVGGQIPQQEEYDDLDISEEGELEESEKRE